LQLDFWIENAPAPPGFFVSVHQTPAGKGTNASDHVTGAFLFAESWPEIQTLAMGSYKGPMRVEEWMGVSPGIFTLILIVAAVLMFWVAELSEKKFTRPDISSEI